MNTQETIQSTRAAFTSVGLGNWFVRSFVIAIVVWVIYYALSPEISFCKMADGSYKARPFILFTATEKPEDVSWWDWLLGLISNSNQECPPTWLPHWLIPFLVAFLVALV